MESKKGLDVLLVGFRRDYPAQGLNRSAIIEITQNVALNVLTGYLKQNGINCRMQEIFYDFPEDILDEDKIADAIKESDPAFVCFSVMDVDNQVYKKFLGNLKNQMEDTRFIVGGYSPTASPAEYVEDDVIVVRGHGEIPLERIIDVLHAKGELSDDDLKDIPRLTWINKEGTISRTDSGMDGEIELKEKVRSDYDSYLVAQEKINPKTGFPWYVKPAWYELPISEMKYQTVSARRGCQNRCSFCMNSIMNRGSIVKRDIDIVIDELKELAAKGINFVFFSDEEFFQDQDYAKRLLEGIIKNGIDKRMKFTAMVSVSSFVRKDGTPKKYADEDLELFKKANFEELQFGVESGSQKMLDQVKKDQTRNSIKIAFEMTREHGISACSMMMIGYANETMESLDETKEFIHDFHPDRVSMYYLSIFPGTVEYMRNKKLVDGIDLWKNDTNIPSLARYEMLEQQMKGKDLTPEEYLIDCRFAMLRDYYSSRSFFNQEKAIYDIRTNKYGDDPDRLLKCGEEWFGELERNFSMTGFKDMMISYLKGKKSGQDIALWQKRGNENGKTK